MHDLEALCYHVATVGLGCSIAGTAAYRFLATGSTDVFSILFGVFGLALACWTILEVVSSGLTDAVPENRTVRLLYVGGVFVILLLGLVSFRS